MKNKISRIKKRIAVQFPWIVPLYRRINKPLSLYPINIPDIQINNNLDFLLLELPPRYQPMMPNGLGYLYNLLKKSGVKFQTIDANIILYHRYFSNKIMNNIKKIRTPPESLMVEDPWDVASVSEWAKDDVIDLFWPQLKEIIHCILDKKPKAVGVSLNGSNRSLAARFLRRIKEKAPEIIIVVGGYDCVYPQVGPFHFQNFDYMVIGEAETSFIPLVTSISKEETVFNLPGIISRFDTPGRIFEPAPILEDLDALDFPKYEWIPYHYYQTYHRRHLVPITGSRGCNWGKCRFCAECFPFRKRSPHLVVDEIEYWVKNGFDSFHFNESDVNGDPQNLYDICSGIIARNIKVKMIGQLRVDKRNTVDYFKHLSRAGFIHLRFGIDGWSRNTLKLQRKGYTIKQIYQNLRDCHSSGIFTTVNMVLGIPGETDNDINEMIENISNLKDNIDLVESMNTLFLSGGSEYTNNPEKYKIRFHGNKEDIYKKHPYHIPYELWFSEDPFIDQDVRLKRLDIICEALHRNGVNLGSFASKVVERLHVN